MYILIYGSRLSSRNCSGGCVYVAGARTWLIIFHMHIRSREAPKWGKQSYYVAHVSYLISKPISSSRHSPSRYYLLPTCSITSPNSATTWRPSAQIYEHIGDIFHSNHHTVARWYLKVNH